MPSFEVLTFIRGASARYPTDRPSIQEPRKNRRPRHSNLRFHQIADAWFTENFGVPYRSQGLFLTSSVGLASRYAETAAHVLRVLPLGEYRYCWSPNVQDLLFAATELADASDERIRQYLSSAHYQETSLSSAWECGHEVMLICERYVAIPIGLLGISTESSEPQIIIPL